MHAPDIFVAKMCGGLDCTGFAEGQIGSRASCSRLSDVQDCRVCGLFGLMHETYVLALVLLIGLCPNQELYLKFYLRQDHKLQYLHDDFDMRRE
jgi:hypothetical protein